MAAQRGASLAQRNFRGPAAMKRFVASILGALVRRVRAPPPPRWLELRFDIVEKLRGGALVVFESGDPAVTPVIFLKPEGVLFGLRPIGLPLRARHAFPS